MKKNLLKFMLTLAMVFSLFAGMTVTASAAEGDGLDMRPPVYQHVHTLKYVADDENNDITVYCDTNSNTCNYRLSKNPMVVTLSVEKTAFDCIGEYTDESVTVDVLNPIDNIEVPDPTFHKKNGFGQWKFSSVNGSGEYKAEIALGDKEVSVEFTIGEHSFTKETKSEATKINEETCQSKGLYKKSCVHCDAISKNLTFEVDELACNYVENDNNKYYVSEATCQHGEVYKKSCSMCGTAHPSDTFYSGRAVGHSFIETDDDTLVFEATCKSGPVYAKSCKWCGCKAILMRDHYVKGDPCDHKYEKEDPAKDKVIPGEIKCGGKLKYFLSCIWCNLASTNPDDCFEHGRPLYNHSYDDEPEYMKNGVELCPTKHFYEALCGDAPIHPTIWEDHAFTESVVADEYFVSEATCYAYATYYKSCKCGKAGTETFEYVAGGYADHTYDTTKWVTDEYEHWHGTTSPCPHEDLKTDVEDHKPSVWLIETPAGYGVKGSQYKKCTVCDRILETKEIPELSTSGPSAALAYKITIEDAEGGEVTSDYKYAYEGDKVTIDVSTDEGFELIKLIVAGKFGNAVKLTDNGDGTYTFTMPAHNVTVTPTFEDPTAEEKSTLVLTIDKTEYVLNGATFNNDVAPVIKNDRTMLPIRLVAETLGADVAWNEAEKFVTIVKDDTVIVIYIGADYALVNGTPVQLDSAAYIENDRTYLPVRFVSECLGATVDWNAETLEVTITFA